jgi:hypothetical protein
MISLKSLGKFAFTFINTEIVLVYNREKHELKFTVGSWHEGHCNYQTLVGQ